MPAGCGYSHPCLPSLPHSGCEAVKRLRRWMPGRGYEVSQRLAKGLLPKFAKAAREGEKKQQKLQKDKKDKKEE